VIRYGRDRSREGSQDGLNALLGAHLGADILGGCRGYIACEMGSPLRGGSTKNLDAVAMTGLASIKALLPEN